MAKTLGTARHKALIDFLIRKREEAGLTQAQLAERLGEYQSFVARLESGQRRVDVVEWLELADILRFDPTETVRALRRLKGEDLRRHLGIANAHSPRPLRPPQQPSLACV